MSTVSITTEPILKLRMPYRENLEIRRTVFQGGHGPKAAVIAGIHGDELEGLYVCHRLARWLEKLSLENPAALLGRVELYPAMNTLGLDTLYRVMPVYDTDLNRNFPGSATGDIPHRVADATMKALLGSSLVIDIHASNIYLREIPQVRINREFAETLVPLANRMNIDLIWIHSSMTVLETTIAHSLNEIGIPCIVVEMGVGMRVTPYYCEQLVAGILTLWQEQGVIAPGVKIPEISHTPLVADDTNVFFLNAPTSGMFVARTEHWIRVARGELLGTIVSPFQGEILAEVRSPVDGILFTLREYPLVYEGSLMARIMATETTR